MFIKKTKMNRKMSSKIKSYRRWIASKNNNTSLIHSWPRRQKRVKRFEFSVEGINISASAVPTRAVIEFLS